MFTASFDFDGQPMKVEQLGSHKVRFVFPAPYAAGERLFGGVPILPCTLDHNSLVGAAELAWQPVLDDPLGALS